MHIHIYIYIYIYIFDIQYIMYVHVYMYIHISMYNWYIDIHTYIYIHIYIYIFIHLYKTTRTPQKGQMDLLFWNCHDTLHTGLVKHLTQTSAKHHQHLVSPPLPVGVGIWTRLIFHHSFRHTFRPCYISFSHHSPISSDQIEQMWFYSIVWNSRPPIWGETCPLCWQLGTQESSQALD